MTSPAPYIDHTLLRADASQGEIRQLCEEAVEFGFAAVCIPPAFVPLAAGLLYGSEVRVATVVAFPLGYVPAVVKVFETTTAVAAGADEIDMVINLGRARAGEFDVVEEEIRQVVRAADGASVKVILECCALDEREKAELTERVARSGAAFVKTSTGFGAGGATVDDVRLLFRVAAGRVGVKAAGGIRDWKTCQAMLAAGATRIGTSAGRTICEEWLRCQQR